MANYKFIGKGAGVPGLPHEISEEEAQQLGVTELLQAALENGSYEELWQKAESTRQTHAAPGEELTSEEDSEIEQ